MRLFVALVPPEKLRQSLEQQGKRLRALCRSGRMVPWERIHLTLAFLGETDRRRAVERAMDRAAGAAFSLHIAGPGRFPGKRGDLWWMGVEESPPLHALRRRLVRALKEEGVGMEGTEAFRPHITLGRDLRPRTEADLEGWAASCPTGTWRVGEMTLMESRRADGGLCYIPLCRRTLEK